MKLSILIDNPKSWFVPYGRQLMEDLRARGHDVVVVSDPREIKRGDCAFFLSSEQVIGRKIRARNTHNLVIHASRLPEGKGWSPLTWQILEGKNEITLTLFEAADEVDAGDVYATETIRFEGHELIDEMRHQEAAAIIALALRFVDAPSALSAVPQRQGGGARYPKRTPKDSELDVHKPLAELFNQLRVADNERYPAFFTHQGHTYLVKIFKKEA